MVTIYAAAGVACWLLIMLVAVAFGRAAARGDQIAEAMRRHPSARAVTDTLGRPVIRRQRPVTHISGYIRKPRGGNPK